MTVWIKFPKNTESVTVDHVEYVSEFTSDEGSWFRAADQTATKLLNMGIGFVGLPVGIVPQGCDESKLAEFMDKAALPETADLSVKVAGLQNELRSAEQAISNLSRDLRNAEAECEALRTRNKELESENASLVAKAEEKRKK